MKTKLIIIGLGNIGKRHLQAISNLNFLEEVLCYDINAKSLDLVPSFCEENDVRVKNLKLISDLDKILKSISKETIVIISTTAKGREKILAESINRQPRAILAEKPLCQKVSDYENIMTLAGTKKVPVYINFVRHQYDFCYEIHKLMKDSKEKSFNAFFSGGMACVGIHMLEMMTWLLNVNSYRILTSRKSEVYETKRKGYCDFSGEMLLETNNSNLCFVRAVKTASEKEKASLIDIFSDEKQFRIYEFAKKMIVSDMSNSIKVLDIEIPYISQITDKIVENIVNDKEAPKLPDIFQAYLAHKILFEYMKINNVENLNIT